MCLFLDPLMVCNHQVCHAWLLQVVSSKLSVLSFSCTRCDADDITYIVSSLVYILTDDQDLKLGSMGALPVVTSLMTKQGLYFENAFVTTPVCCPSR